MKRKILILLVIVFSMTLTSYGQIFPEGTAYWRYYYFTMFDNYIHDYQYQQEGDTIINYLAYKKNYKSLRVFEPSSDSTIYEYFKNYVGALRSSENEKQVFLIPKDSVNEVLLYDFNLSVGDTIPIWHRKSSLSIYDVKKVDTINLNNVDLKRFYIKLNNTDSIGRMHYIIEGIGSTRNLIDVVAPDGDAFYFFRCFEDLTSNLKYYVYDNCDLLSYNNQKPLEKEISIYPNPCIDKFKLSIAGLHHENYSATIYNNLGLSVLQINSITNETIINVENLQNGIYLLRIESEGKLIKTKKLIIK